MNSLQFISLPGLPLIQPGDDLAGLIASAAAQAGLILTNTDIVLIAQKVVSKAEGRFVKLAHVTPSARARELAAITGKPAELVEVILWDTAQIIRAQKELLIVEHALGFICANAGVDRSNVSLDEDVLLRLPANPDASARAIRQRLAELTGARPPVLIIDSHGRPWRQGAVGVTIGLSGLSPVQDLRGAPDLFGRRLQHTIIGLADPLAATATLIMGQAAEGSPVVMARGLPFTPDEHARAADGLRAKENDLFR